MPAPSRPSLRSALNRTGPLILPVAHDALTARLVERAGFEAFAIGGSSMLAARYALPDLGLAALGEMTAGIHDIAAATRLPFITDGDDGYGDIKSVARMMDVYQAEGVGGVVLEDQARADKQPGDNHASNLVSAEELCRKLIAATAARADPELLIIARTDAYGPLGLDEAMRRAELYLKSGADGIFVPGIRTPEELRRLGDRFRGVPQMIVVTEGGATPWLPPAEIYDLGFSMIAYPAAIVSRVVWAAATALEELKEFAAGRQPMLPFPNYQASRAALSQAVRFSEWQERGSAAAAG